MIREDVHEVMTQLELRREISKLKLEIKHKDKIIEKLKQELEKRKWFGKIRNKTVKWNNNGIIKIRTRNKFKNSKI